jgi:hypothetical protein
MALLFLFCGCAAPRVAAPGLAERTLGERLESALYRGAAPSRVGDLRIGRGPGGAARVDPVRERAPGREDTAVAADVRARLAAEPVLLPFEISVDVDGGVARLAGALDGREEAARAVLTALDVRDVRAVEITLSWVPPRDLARLRSFHP